jgi:hypothetical protein
VPKVKVSTITSIKIDHSAGSSRIFLVPELLFMATLLLMQSEEKFNHPQKYLIFLKNKRDSFIHNSLAEK